MNSNSNITTLDDSQTQDHEESIWITCKEARELTGRGKTSIKNWIDSQELPTRKSENGVTLVSKTHLIDLHASRRQAGAVEVPESQAVETAAVQSGDDIGQHADEPADKDEGVATDAVSTSQVVEEPTTQQEPSNEVASGDHEQIAATPIESPALEEKIEITSISFDECTQIRERVHEKVVTEYALKMKSGEKFPPVILFRDDTELFIGDGWHRLHAAKKNGYAHFPAQVYGGGKSAAIRYALRANITHGLRLTSADKRKKVTVALREYPTLSTNEIANISGVSESMVRSIRDRFAKNEPGKRIGADGKAYPARTKERNGGNKDNVLFNRTAKLAQKLTVDELKQLKEIIEARLQKV